MALDVTHGNITMEEAERLSGGSREEHEPGSTEPWISDLVGAFVVARGAHTVLETGSFMGRTSKVIADSLAFLGGGTFVVFESDARRAALTRRRLEAYPSVATKVYTTDALQGIAGLAPRSVDVAFIDDDHSKKHVERELILLLPKMALGGLVLLHDVWGATDLQSVVAKFGGYSLDFGRMGPAGGLGILQVR